MSFYQVTSIIPDYYVIGLLNSYFIASYVNCFINNTQSFGIDDARQIPIIIPTEKYLEGFKNLFNNAINIKKKQNENIITNEDAESELSVIQQKLDKLVAKLYKII